MDQHQGRSCSPGIPQICTPGFGVQRGSPGRGGNGRHYPPRLLTLPMWSSTDSTSCSEQHVPPISSLRAVMGKGEAEQSHATRPPEPPRTPRCAQHRRAPSPGSGEALRISQMLLFPRQELRSRLLPTPRLAHRSPSRGWQKARSRGSVREPPISPWSISRRPPHALTLGARSRGAGQGEHGEAEQPPAPEPGHGSAETSWEGCGGRTSPKIGRAHV